MADPQILTAASDDALARATEENLFALFRAMAGSLPGGELEERDTLSRHHAFPANPMFKGAWCPRLSPPNVEEAILETLAWFRERGAPFMFFWTGPGSTPPDLGDRLSAQGLLSMEEQQKVLAHGIVQTAAGAPCMVADLGHMNEDVLGEVPEGFEIDEVADAGALADFTRVFAEAFQVPDFAAQAWADATTTIGIGRTPWRLFVGRLHGETVATNMLFNGGGVASVYAVSTLPALRGKGVGGAVTLGPLLLARDEGYRHAVLFSSEMGIRAYERIGFRLTSGRINRYMWRAPA